MEPAPSDPRNMLDIEIQKLQLTCRSKGVEINPFEDLNLVKCYSFRDKPLESLNMLDFEIQRLHVAKG